MKWRVAHLGTGTASRERSKQIISRFQQIYQGAGSPKGVALYDAIDFQGQMYALCLSPAAVEYCSQLFEESFPWPEHDDVSMFKPGWIAGDRSLNDRF